MFAVEDIYCAKHLQSKGYLENGVLSKILSESLPESINFKLVAIKSKEFYIKLATALRELWPAGNKDGKYPWRESVANLAARLEMMWEVQRLGDYSIDDCLIVARRYLAQYESNIKYMSTVKYFVLKQKKLVGKDGLIKYQSTSILASMLESSPVDEEKEEWNKLFESDDFTGSYAGEVL